MPTVRCPGCDETMDIDADWYGRRLACPACDHRFTPRRPGARDDESDDPPPRPRRRRYDDEDEWDDRPRRRNASRYDDPPPKKGGAGKTLLVLGVIGGMLLLACGGAGVAGWSYFTGPVDYSAPWVAQPLPDGSYSAQFPRTPKSETLRDNFANPCGTKYALVEALPRDAAFAFGVVNAPGLTFEEAWQAEVTEITSAGLKKGVPRDGTYSGLRGREVEFTLGGSSVTYRLLDATPPGGPTRYLVVMAGGRNVSAADRKKFLDSIQANR